MISIWDWTWEELDKEIRENIRILNRNANWKIDWTDGTQTKCNVCYSHDESKLIQQLSWSSQNHDDALYFYEGGFEKLRGYVGHANLRFWITRKREL